MGYYIDQVGSNFFIRKENIQSAWDALIKLFKTEEKSILDSSGYHYSWIDTDTVLNAKTFIEAMSEARWDMEEDDNGNIDSIYFNGEKYGDEEIILGAIAPFVEPGSYIEIQGEEYDRWRWEFKDGMLYEVYGKWVWNDEEG